MLNKNKTNTACGSSGQEAEKQKEEIALKENMNKIKNKIIILSGKGGVGKSTVAVNLAVSLAKNGNKVGLLDIDIHGPSVPKLLGLDNCKIETSENKKLIPADYNEFLKVISIGFLIDDDNDPVVWRGPLKYAVIKQFLKDVEWGHLDYLIVDSPPGTGDEPLSICQLIDDPTGAVVVTTPQDIALLDVRKSVTFCGQVHMPILGVVENMSGFTCPHCDTQINIFKTGGGEKMAYDMNIPFLGTIPLNADIALGGDAGKPILSGESTTGPESIFNAIVKKILSNTNKY
ncbi:MAG: Mrp/NBP35 family ATP-binding protein [bacterium]|nr:Mrp/NBP35 family ATP-binding protein [bacterium]